MAAELDVSMTEDTAEELLYLGRTGELEELTTAIQTFAERKGGVNEQTVSALLTQVQHFSTSHNSPLHYAAANGHEDIVRYLIPFCTLATLLAQNESGNTALHWAAFNGRMNVVKMLVDRIESLAMPKSAKPIADHITEQERDAELEKEAQKRSVWDVVNKAGRGPMSEAQMNNKEDVVDFLLQRMVTAPAAAKEEDVVEEKGSAEDAVLSDNVQKQLDLGGKEQS